MSHPFAEHRRHKVEHERVGHITKGYASGGAVRHHDDEAEDKALIRSELKKHDAKEGKAHKASGGSVKHRQDRKHRAKGGRVHKGKTNVNVIVASHPPGAPSPMPTMPPAGLAAAGPAPTPVPVPRPPMPVPMAGPLPGAGPMSGMPPRRKGGRAYAKGGRVIDGPAWAEGRRNGTQVQHTDGKQDGKDIGRPPVITKARGGAIDHPVHGGMAPKLPGGAGGGEARLAKEQRAARKHH